ILATLEKYPTGAVPRPGLKDQVLQFLDGFLAAETIDLQNPPLVDRLSDAQAWARALYGLEPEMEEPGFAARILQENSDRMLSVVWLSADLVEEPHDTDAFLESFLILEGACECDFGGVIARFSAGDYFEVPPNTPHVIKNISENLPYVKGLVQRKRAA
ncbi:MAG TPA: cupin domain-containing protein, partial [Saprospiraceae bacterium]|nr:cupin domain-containing protein [Saprospiraceae bacterium]